MAPRQGKLMTEQPGRPYTILLYTMGGQGGAGVEPMAAKGGRILCDWVVRAARAAGYPVQSTLTPGTGQRTGVNTLYVEIYPVAAQTLGGRKPVFRLAPRPGDIDLLVAYELVEAGRALTQGLVSSARTTLVASTHRFYTLTEKAATTDGRYDAATIRSAAETAAQHSLMFDMAAVSQASGGSVNAVAAGALAALETFPIDAKHLEQAVAETADGINSTAENLAAFTAGRAAAKDADAGPRTDVSAKRQRPRVARLQKRLDDEFPEAVRQIVEESVARVAEFQSAAYAMTFLDRLAGIHRLDDGGPDSDYRLTRETSRYLALWMSYDDIIRVADLKTRPERLARIRGEVGVDAEQPLRVTEYFKPGVDEWTAVLPAPLGRWLRRLGKRLGIEHRLNVNLHIRSTALWGYFLLRVVANLRFLRPVSLGLVEETARIDRWLTAIQRAADRDYRLAVEIAECARLIKGYGETRQRGYAQFGRVFEKLVQPALDGWLHQDDASVAVRRARAAAFADPDGNNIDARLDEIAAAANADVAAAEIGGTPR